MGRFFRTQKPKQQRYNKKHNRHKRRRIKKTNNFNFFILVVFLFVIPGLTRNLRSITSMPYTSYTMRCYTLYLYLIKYGIYTK